MAQMPGVQEPVRLPSEAVRTDSLGVRPRQKGNPVVLEVSIEALIALDTLSAKNNPANAINPTHRKALECD